MSRTRNWLVTGAIWFGASLASIAQPVGAASAQRPADAAPELVEAILRHAYRFDGGNVRVLNGRVPEDIANFYVPPGTRVLGSVVHGSSVRVFATTSAPVDSLRELYTRALRPAGWQPFSWGPSRGGFVDARRDMPIMFCRDGAQLQIQRLPGAAGSHDVVLDYRDGMGPCEQRAGMASVSASAVAVGPSSSGVTVRGHISEAPRFPTLYSPEDAGGAARTRCFQRGGSYGGLTSTGTVVPSTMSAADLLRHYAKQLEAEGWRAPGSRGSQSAVGTWTLADTSGIKEVTIQIVESSRAATGCFDVQMRMSERPR